MIERQHPAGKAGYYFVLNRGLGDYDRYDHEVSFPIGLPDRLVDPAHVIYCKRIYCLGDADRCPRQNADAQEVQSWFRMNRCGGYVLVRGGSVVPGDKGSILFVGRRVLYNGCTRVHSRIGLKAGRGFKLHERLFITGQEKGLQRYKEKKLNGRK